jgi:hypothetical protein
MLRTAEYLIETADRCIRLAGIGRQVAEKLEGKSGLAAEQAKLVAASRHVAEELEAMSKEFLAKAVEIDTERQRFGVGRAEP